MTEPVRTARPLTAYRVQGFAQPIIVVPGWRTYLFVATVFPFLVFASGFAAVTAEGLTQWIGLAGLFGFGGGGAFYIMRLVDAAQRGALTLTEAGVAGLTGRERNAVTPWSDLGPAWVWDQRTAAFTTVRHVMLLARRDGRAQSGWAARALAGLTGPGPVPASYLIAGEADAQVLALRLDGALAARRREGVWAQAAMPTTLDTRAREDVATIINLELLKRADADAR